MITAYFIPFQGHTCHVQRAHPHTRSRAFLARCRRNAARSTGSTPLPANQRTTNMAMTTKVEGDKLILTIDISKEALKAAKPSSTGKTLSVASTHGFARFGDVNVSLNATIPNPDYAKA